MRPALAVLDEVRMRGGAAYRLGDRVRIFPASAASPDLVERIREQKQQLLPMLPLAPPHVAAAAAVESPSSCSTWIISASGGEMRLLVASSPPWPHAVFRAAALVEVIDRRHRAGRDAAALDAACELESLLIELRGHGVEAWLSS